MLTVTETQVMLVASAVAYSQFYDGDDKVGDMPLFTAVTVLVGMCVLALGTFVLSINRAYMRTFFSPETGAQFVRGRFEHFAGSDERRLIIFGTHPALWASFAKDVEAWVKDRYAAMAVQPWYTPDVAAQIPAEFLPLRSPSQMSHALVELSVD